MPPEQGSTIAPQVDTVLLVLISLSILFAGIVFTGLIYFSIKYRRGSKADRSNPPTQNLKLEAVWIGVPLILALAVFTWGASVYFNIVNPPADALNIYVVGKQWMWKFQHPEGPTEISDLHVPVNRPIRLNMISQDVIHSFFIPAFRVKQDVLPGRYSTLWFQATQPGTYNLFCTQYCGAGHPVMGGRIIVMEAAQYDQWLHGGKQTASGGAPSLASMGSDLFQQFKCGGCHLDNDRGAGPSLVGLYGQSIRLDDGSTVTADDSYLRDSILTPDRHVVAGYKSSMPAYQGQLDETQVVELLTYIESLGEIKEARR